MEPVRIFMTHIIQYNPIEYNFTRNGNGTFISLRIVHISVVAENHIRIF